MTGAKLLVVDDDPAIGSFLQRILQELGYTVYRVENGKTALDLVDKFRPELILLDIIMPDINGYEVCKQLKSRNETKDIPVIFITGLSESKDEVRGLRAGGVDYITKPFKSSVVKARVANILEIQQGRQLLEDQAMRLKEANREYRELLADRNKTAGFLNQRDAILRAVNFTAEIFLKNQDWEEVITDVLEQLSRTIGADGAYFTTLRPGEFSGRQYRWQMDSQKTTWCPSYTVLADIESVYNPLSQGVIVSGRTDGIEKEAGRALQQQGTAYYCLIPVFSGQRWLGCLGFDWQTAREECPSVIRDALSIVADTLGASLQRCLTNQERDRLAVAIRQFDDCVCMVDDKGRIFYANPASQKVTGYHHTELIGKHIDAVQIDESTKSSQQMLEKSDKGQIWHGQIQNRRKDGTLYDEEVTVLPIREGTDQVSSYILIKRDVTDQLRLESIAEAANLVENVGFVFSGIRHELGNPLNSLKMALSVLVKEIHHFSSEQIMEFLNRCLGEVERMEYLLYSLKNFNLHEEIDPEPAPLHDFLEHFLQIHKNDLSRKNINLTLDEQEQNLSVLIDKRAFHQVLLNLLTNAINALNNTTDPYITISCQSTKKGFVEICFKDNGCGITTGDEAHLFQPFFTTRAEGTGLGLTIVKKMLTEMDATIDIKNRTSEGTAVTITLPEAEKNRKLADSRPA
ncbi:MAG: response regulator [Thermodesulfobacteriota bacterium]